VLTRTELRRNDVTCSHTDENLQLVGCERFRCSRCFSISLWNAIEAMAAVVARPKLLTIETVADEQGDCVSQDSGVAWTSGCWSESSSRSIPRSRAAWDGLAVSRALFWRTAAGYGLLPTKPQTTFRFQLPFNRRQLSEALECRRLRC